MSLDDGLDVGPRLFGSLRLRVRSHPRWLERQRVSGAVLRRVRRRRARGGPRPLTRTSSRGYAATEGRSSPPSRPDWRRLPGRGPGLCAPRSPACQSRVHGGRQRCQRCPGIAVRDALSERRL